jgi:peptidoglycan-associated lipoprotein
MDASPTLDTDARLLKAENGWKLIISGHGDERGTSAYNLVLGERRAQTVKKYLEDLGIPSSQMQIVSYGKEKPFCNDHSEDCWQKNRRAHFVVQ